MKLLV